jgi:hypothetical protein
MKKFLLLSLCSIAPAFAVLSPMNQSVRELTTILASNELRSALPQGEFIQEITVQNLISQEGEPSVWRRLYTISTASDQVSVTLTYTPSKRVGPQQFSLEFSK